ncbi:MAG: lysine biosynthesis protein LysX [Thaumarchaeota archaeon]|nr:lysine biosynthesis protein LysX [Nitrososphaerota archaeon]
MTSFTILYDMIRWEEKAIAEAAKRKGADVHLVDAREMALDVTSKSSGIADHVILERCVSHYRNIHATAALESLGHRVVNDFRTAYMSSDKLFCSLALARAGIPTPRTFLAFTEESAKKSLAALGYPGVIKPVVGSWGRLSALIKDEDFATAILEDREYMYPMYQVYYLQEFVKRPPRDIRSFVIGDRTVAAIYRLSSSDWRTNTARGGKAIPCPVTDELNELSLKSAKAVGGEIVGVDLMESPDGMLVHEVNNTTEFKNTVPATGIDIPGFIVDYLVSLEKR